MQIEKRDDNTEWVARQLARAFDVKPTEVGYCGLKDRRALATQWFSLPRRGRDPDALPTGLPESLRILRDAAHRRKLRRGSHRGNHFRIRLRAFRGERDALGERLRQIAAAGFPNYFGPQRFGEDGANLDKADAMLDGRLRVRGRHQRGLYLSAIRAWLFNRLLSERLAAGTWLQVREGDWLNLAGSASRFRAEPPLAPLQARLDELDLHPTAALWGRDRADRPQLLEAERCGLAAFSRWCEGLEKAGLEAERRPARCVPLELRWHFAGPDLWLEFGLPRGAYATALLRELIGDQSLRRNA